MASWIESTDVARYLDVEYPDTDGRVDQATDAVRAAVERRRSDLTFLEPFADVPPDVRGAAIEWAAMIYQARSSPSGFPGYSDDTVLYDSLGSRRGDILRRLGWRRPVAM